MNRTWKIAGTIALALVTLIVACRWLFGCGKNPPPAPPTPATTQSPTPQNNDSLVKALAAAQQNARDAQAMAQAAMQAATACAKCGPPRPRHAGGNGRTTHMEVSGQGPVQGVPQTEPTQGTQSQTPPAATQPSDDRKSYTREEIEAMVDAKVANSVPKVSPTPPPAPVNVTVSQAPEAPKAVPLTMVCAKPLDKQGNCSKWRKATIKDWEKQYPAPTSFADLQKLRQANSLNSLVKVGIADVFVEGGKGVAEGLKDQTATSSSSSYAAASSSSSAVATSHLAQQAAGFGVVGTQ